MTKDLVQDANALERSGRLAEAAERWRDAVRVAPTGEALARLGRLCLRQGDMTEGERVLQDAILRFPDHPDAYFYLGTHYKEHGEIEEARRLLQRSVELDEWAPALVSLGHVHRRLKETEVARRCFERATVLEPGNSEAWFGVGLTYLSLDDDRARELFQKAVGLDPENGAALRELGYMLWRQGDPASAEDSIRKALGLDARDPWAHDYLGIVLRWTDRDEEAEQEFRAAADLWPDVPLFHCHLGDALIGLGRHAEGKESYKRALSRDTSNYLANLRMGQLLKEQGRARQARRYIERRAYDPELGRWLSSDPLGDVEGPNRYAYVGNRPINMRDMLGLQGMNASEARLCITNPLTVGR